SELAERALSHARAAALAHGAAVHLLQVVDPADLTAPALRATVEPAGNLQEPDRSAGIEAWETSAVAYLEHVAAHLRTDGVTEVTVAVKVGNPYDLVPDEAAAAGCDLVVMASHGRSGLGRALLGSI